MAPDHAHEVTADPETKVTADPGEANIIAGRYELRDQIGRGAFGVVHEVYDRRLGRLAALKTMPIGARDNAEAAADLHRFYQEAQAVARLSHPGIVTVHDFGETGGNAWIVMELVIGKTLRAVLDRGERPPVAESARVVCDLLDALHYAHGRGIVHRDVKPANILLAVEAEDGLGAVRLADFGIALMGDAGAATPGEMVGTPSTMAPEQLRGDSMDGRADLWAVGTGRMCHAPRCRGWIIRVRHPRWSPAWRRSNRRASWASSSSPIWRARQRVPWQRSWPYAD